MKLSEIFYQILEPGYIKIGNLDYRREETSTTITYYFQQTASFADALADAYFFPKMDRLYSTKNWVHRGIYNQYKLIRDQFLDDVYKGKEMLVAGYSLGAAITTLAIQDAVYHIIRDDLKTKVFGVAIEGPRVMGGPGGNFEVCLIRTHNWLDPVVHLPFWILGFRHYGKKLKLPIAGNILKQHVSKEVKKQIAKYEENLSY